MNVLYKRFQMFLNSKKVFEKYKEICEKVKSFEEFIACLSHGNK
jgi:hypothetical protein